MRSQPLLEAASVPGARFEVSLNTSDDTVGVLLAVSERSPLPVELAEHVRQLDAQGLSFVRLDCSGDRATRLTTYQAVIDGQRVRQVTPAPVRWVSQRASWDTTGSTLEPDTAQSYVYYRVARTPWPDLADLVPRLVSSLDLQGDLALVGRALVEFVAQRGWPQYIALATHTSPPRIKLSVTTNALRAAAAGTGPAGTAVASRFARLKVPLAYSSYGMSVDGSSDLRLYARPLPGHLLRSALKSLL